MGHHHMMRMHIHFWQKISALFFYIFLFDFYQKNNDMSKVKVECNGNKIGANGVLHCSIAQRNFDFIQYER